MKRTCCYRRIAAACFCLMLPSVTMATPRMPADSLRIERLVALGKLWNAVKFFHPSLAYRDIDWDAALVAAIPQVNAATSGEEYAAAVQLMLDKLNDPATRVMPKASSAAIENSGARHPLSKFTADSLLLVTISNYSDLTDFDGAIAKMQAIGKELAHARGIVFDLRSPMPIKSEVVGMLAFLFNWSALNGSFASTPVSTLGQRTRMHAGFAPQSGGTSGDYYSSFVVSDGQEFQPAATARDKPTVFLSNDNAELPPIALALQAAGKAAIVAEGNVSEASVIKTQRMTLTDGVEVRLRLSELIAEDGASGFRANLVVPANATTNDAALEAALALARRADFKTSFARQTLPARAVPPAERVYAEMHYPPLEYRLLAAFRIWGNINYFFPYKHLMEEDWEGVLKAFLPKMTAARDSLEYALAVAEMVTHIHDSHGFIRSEILQGYFGVAPPPVRTRMIEGVPVVTSFLDETVARAAGLEIGDVILKVDGEEAQARIDRYAKYIAASTPHGQKLAVMWRFLNGADSSIATLTLRDRNHRVKEVKLLRSRAYWANAQSERTGDMLKLLPDNIGYADLGRMPVAMVDSMFERFKDAKAIIFDMRGYPLGTAWAIAPRLTEKRNVAAALFERRIAASPDSPNGELMNEAVTQTFVQRLPHSEQWKYKGKTVMLIDERTISQAEHTGLFFEAANGTKFVGSHTMGANGDVTNFYVPGGMLIHFTGQSVKHADGRQLQRLGLVPDVEAKPTIQGIRSGRDEVLEKALEFIAKGAKEAPRKKS